ncbi:ABC transporter ATP-binding protein [Corynebacterium minutissimum]|uniref:ABC transporter ATP-binding protein n=1 Tax=Corynebacterium minutissimum TaxID=38301 RepID=A0A2X4RPY1_9CORY|nr:ABC transporter ATP-binding protein [Corynebacterium minutissimum]QPS59805.1 ABC transporter ATP-binding protein [Corynebacterium minutissimum]QQA79404.1 ABC transporter ATP-binding protein [Corynebacterium minutissimum]SQH98400.1 cell division ATP-binding protein FtsE [Corynebacterium minutissimum]VEG04526.1 cell division ATP-binding protein FtsE [Corynebacterium minutissimum]
MNEEVINIRDGQYSIGQRTLWSGVNADITAGQMVAISGPSGCGKTTLLNCLGLLDSFSGGSMRVLGHDVMNMKERQARKLRRTEIGYLFQDFALVDVDSVADNVAVALPPATPEGRKASIIADALEKVGLAGREAEKAYSLSGGEQQRVSFARILVRSPRLILADEPTAALDTRNADRVMALLQEQAQAGAAVIVVTHDDRVRQQCDSTFDLSAHCG